MGKKVLYVVASGVILVVVDSDHVWFAEVLQLIALGVLAELAVPQSILDELGDTWDQIPQLYKIVNGEFVLIEE